MKSTDIGTVLAKATLTVALAAVLAASVWGCRKEQFSPLGEGQSLNVEGKEIARYDELSWQTVLYSDNTVVMTSDDRSEWYSIHCSEYPSSAGQEITADLKWKSAGSDDINSRNGLRLKVYSIDYRARMIGLWDSSNDIALQIMDAR